MAEVVERVSRLEEVFEEFIRSVGIEFNKLYNSQMRTEAEMREFKEEMRAFREESEKDRKALHEVSSFIPNWTKQFSRIRSGIF